jgi:uncharacterized membrane protein
MASKSTEILTKAATEFAAAKAGDVIKNIGDRASGNSPSKSKTIGSDDGESGANDDNGEESKGFIGNTMENIAEGGSAVGSAVKGAGTAVKEGVKGLFSRKGGSKRPHNIVEDVWIGVAPDVCFEAFTTWEEFPSFMKGPTSVTRGDETPEDDLEEGQHPLEGEETNWKGKVFLSTREQKSTTVDYDPPHRVSWKSEGPKGTIDGTVTFTPLGDNATLMLVVLEYRSKGPVEWIANRWRAVGRRCRLDLKHFRRYVMRTEPDDLPEPEEEPTDEGPEELPTDEEPEEPTDETPEEPEDEEPTDEEPEEPESDEPDEPDEPEAPEAPEEPEAPEPMKTSRPARRARG